MDRCVLADLERRQVEPERRQLPAQVRQLTVGDPREPVGDQRILEDSQLGIQGSGLPVAARARCRFAGQRGPGPPEALGDAAQALAVRLIGEAAPELAGRVGELLRVTDQRGVESAVEAGGRHAGRHGLHQPARDCLVPSQEVVRTEARRLEGHLRGHARVPITVGPDPRPQAKQRRSVRGPRARPPGIARNDPVRPPFRDPVKRPVDGPSEARDRDEQRLVEDGQRRTHLVERGRRDGPQVARVPEQRDLLAQAAAEIGVLVGRREGIVHGIEQPADAALRDEESPAARLGGVGGQDRVDLHPGEPRHDLLASQAGAEARDRIADRVVDRPAARPAGTRAQGADPVPLLGEVDELEVDREGVADGGELPEIEVADPGCHAPAIAVPLRRGRPVVATGRDHPAADPLHQDEQLRAALLGDHLPEE